MSSSLAHDPAALRATLKALPKIDLHRHLEGSLRLETLVEIAARFDIPIPTTVDGLRPLVQVTGNDHNYRDFLAKFETLRLFYQSPDTVSRLAYEAIADAAADNVQYLELRFTPMALAKARNFPLEDVVDWVIEAAARAQADYQVAVGLIASFNRHESIDIAQRVTRIALDRLGKGIVGLDLAGDEVNFGAKAFAPLFAEARAGGLGITVHAGEWSGPETVRTAIEQLSAMRIGHGVRVLEDPDVTQLAVERGVTLEVCLTSNWQTGVVKRLEDHPLRRLHERGLRTTINTDDPSLCGVTLTDEYIVAAENAGLGLEDIRHAILTAAESAFLPPEARAALTTRFRALLSGTIPDETGSA